MSRLWWAAAAVSLCTLAFYVAALCPSAYWLDSSEFAAAAFLLGVPHPPGHPLATLLGKAMTLLPLGPVALRVGLGQALCGSVAAGLLVVIGARLAARTRAALTGAPGATSGEAGPPDLAEVLLGAAAGLLTSLGYAAAFQAMRPEVYALQRLLSLWGVYHLLRYDETRDLRQVYLAAFALGLGLVNHHFMTLLLVPPALSLIWPTAAERADLAGHARRVIGAALAAVALALLFYLYLPLRGAHHTQVNWGSPTTWSRVYWVVSAVAFQKSVTHGPLPGDEENLGYMIGAIVDAVHPVGAVLAAVGLYLLVRQRPLRRVGLYLLGAVALVAGGRAVMGFDVANPDAYGYLAPGNDLLAACACAGASALLLLTRLSPRLLAWRVPAAGGLVLGALGLGAASFSLVDRSGFYDLDTLLGGMLDEAPQRSLLLSSYFQTQFGLWYLQGVEGQRPDVTHVHPHFLPNPGYREDVLARHPDELLGPVLGQRSVQLEPLLVLDRPVVVEYDLETPAALAAHLVPFGLAERLAQGVPTAAELGAASAAAQDRRKAVLALLDRAELETGQNLFWRAFLRATLSCLQKDRVGYAGEMERLRLLQGQARRSPELDELERRCRF